jgi:hypothetical protein
MVANALLRERFGRIEIPARHAGRRWLPCSGVHPPLGLSASLSSLSDLGPDGSHPPLLPAVSVVAILDTRASTRSRAMLREPESFSMCPQLRPPSRNVNLTLISYCKALLSVVS